MDLTGETVWIREIIEKFVGRLSLASSSTYPSYLRYEYIAAKSGAIIVPSCGLDSIPSDLSAFLGNKTLKSHGMHLQQYILVYVIHNMLFIT